MKTVTLKIQHFDPEKGPKFEVSFCFVQELVRVIRNWHPLYAIILRDTALLIVLNASVRSRCTEGTTHTSARKRETHVNLYGQTAWTRENR